jgi:hypothetical protein
MDPRLVDKVVTFPPPSNKKECRSFLGTVGFYRRFMSDFAKVALPLFDLLKNDVPYVWTATHQNSFLALKRLLTQAPVLALPDQSLPFSLFTDASNVALGAVLTQKHADGVYHPIAYYSRKLTPAQVNYTVHDREFMAIKDALVEWKHYLLGETDTVVFTDHRPLVHLHTQKDLNPRQIRWLQIIAPYQITIQYISGKDNVVADLLSRPPTSLNMLTVSDSTHAVSALLPDPQVGRKILLGYKKDKFIVSLRKCMKQMPVPKVYNSLNVDCVQENADGYLFYVDPSSKLMRLIVPADDSIKQLLFDLHHTSVSTGHPGRDKMHKDMVRYYYWPKMYDDIAKFCAQCQTCQFIKSQNQVKAGFLQPLPIPSHAWEQVSMDFVVKLPVTSKGNNTILVMVDRFSKWAYFVPAKSPPLDAPLVARLFLEHVYRNHGMAKSIISDRDSRFTSEFWKELMSKLGCKAMMSTAYHPQTDGQTERVIRTLEDMIRCYCDEYTDDWDELLIPLEMAYNDSFQASTKFSPFYMNYGRHPRTPQVMVVGLQEEPKTAASSYLSRLSDCHRAARFHMKASQLRQAQNANKNRRPAEYKVGDKVLLSVYRIRGADGKLFQKLQPKWCGPFEVTRVIKHNAVELNSNELGHAFHNVVNVDRLKPYVTGVDVEKLNSHLEKQFRSIDLEAEVSPEVVIPDSVDGSSSDGDVSEEEGSESPVTASKIVQDDIRIVLDDCPYEPQG